MNTQLNQLIADERFRELGEQAARARRARPRRRGRRLLLAALLPAALSAAALPASASAAVLSLDDGELRYDGLSERNTLSLRQVAGALIVSDPSGLSNRGLPSAPNPGERPCAQVDRQTMRCPVPRRFFADMDEGDDSIGPINTNLPVVIHGGPGVDTYNAGNPSFLTHVEFRGGAEVVSYAGSAGSGGGRGVRISNDGVANDGRIGLDSDNIGREVTRLVGSPSGDEITASVNSDLGRVFVTPGQGDDVMRAGSGPANGVLFFRMGPVADGADKIIGGPVPSVLVYDDRTRPVNATLNFGGADDGEAGERDEILGGHEFLHGGQAGDTLRAPSDSRAPHSISGLGGDDQIAGAEGADRLFGGAGSDAITGFGGADQLFAKDGETDNVDCGLETDTFEVDSTDNLGDNCENGTVGVLRLSPKALRAKAGEVARLRLSWRHPVAWRKLRTVELRLTQDGRPVGEVTIRPRTARITADGAVNLVRKQSRLARKGKAVSAQLALRLDRSIARRRLRLDVQASDVRGARQLERNAGSIRVSG